MPLKTFPLYHAIAQASSFYRRRFASRSLFSTHLLLDSRYG
jgi:hypothetical protein